MRDILFVINLPCYVFVVPLFSLERNESLGWMLQNCFCFNLDAPYINHLFLFCFRPVCFRCCIFPNFRWDGAKPKHFLRLIRQTSLLRYTLIQGAGWTSLLIISLFCFRKHSGWIPQNKSFSQYRGRCVC